MEEKREFENAETTGAEALNTEALNVEGTNNMEYSYTEGNAAAPAIAKERVFLGIIGAFAGALIGTICIVLLGQLGYIASICGVIMGACAIGGYQLLGKAMSKKGIIISIAIMVIMVYVSNWISYAIAVADVAEVDFMTAFLVTPSLVSEGLIDAGAYYKDLVMLYIFTALGAVPTMKKYFK